MLARARTRRESLEPVVGYPGPPSIETMIPVRGRLVSRRLKSWKPMPIVRPAGRVRSRGTRSVPQCAAAGASAHGCQRIAPACAPGGSASNSAEMITSRRTGTWGA